MAYVITSICERKGACYDVCPTDSIHFVEEDDNAFEEWSTYYINPETCIDCGACYAECPTEAIFMEDEVPDEYEDDIKKNLEFFTDGPGKDMV
ncbi:MAG: ferredoxin family protein [Anaerolineae bacterium]|nr:ferredoxin family protein [Anaerolineae bacterium]